MARRVLPVLALLALMIQTTGAQDARMVLQAAAAAIGADVKTIEISGTGMVAAVGQSYSPAVDYPKFEVTKYTKTIDYDGRSSREELTRRQGSFPARGGGGTPLQGEQRQVSIVNGNYAWNVDANNNAVPAPTAAEQRQLDIWLTPHGFIKAALAANPPTTIETRFLSDGEKELGISFVALGKYRVNGSIDSKNQIKHIQTWIANPIVGDMIYEIRFPGDYKDFGGVKYPPVLHAHTGEPRLYTFHNSSEIIVSGVRVNVNVPALSVPEAVRSATVPPIRVASQKLAEGVWLIGGGSHNSVAVEFRDFVTVIEAPLNEQRSLAVIGEVNKLVPNKRIKYLTRPCLRPSSMS